MHCADLFTLCNAQPNASVDMILCDLPYGVTEATGDNRIPIEPMWDTFKRIIKPCGVIVLTATEPFASLLRVANLGWFKYDWIIYKQSIVTNVFHAKNRPMVAHENILAFSSGGMGHEGRLTNRMPYYPQMTKGTPYCKTRGKSGMGAPGGRIVKDRPSWRVYIQNNQGERYPKSVLFSYKNNNFKTFHPFQKDVEIFEYLIRTYTQPGAIVFDPCVGSGTTATATFRAGRHYICGDIMPEYVDIAQRRVQNADPYHAKQLDDTHTQLSLFQESA